MAQGICHLSQIAVRAQPDHSSEMKSQILFGECYEVLDREDHWYFISSAWDQTTGWIWDLHYHAVDHQAWVDSANNYTVVQKPVQIWSGDHKGTSMLIWPGSSLPLFEEDNQRFRIGHQHFKILGDPQGQSYKKTESGTDQYLIFLNIPFLWGGRSFPGLDPSGFVQLIKKINNSVFPRHAGEQIKEGRTINFPSEVTTGDLAFFGIPEEGPVHCGVLLDSSRIIHVEEKVRIDSFDHQGIYNHELGKYTHALRLIKRS